MPNPRERVRAVARAIPAGDVMTYGEIGRATGLHARHVGRIVAGLSDEIPWWRVVFADGSPATCHEGGAADLLRQEHVPFAGAKVSWTELRGDGRRAADDEAPDRSRRRSAARAQDGGSFGRGTSSSTMSK